MPSTSEEGRRTSEEVRRAWAVVNLDVIEQNARLLAQTMAPAELCAVVKADGYGHGASAVAHAALAGGATRLAVALVEEGCQLRRAGIAAPILVLSEPTPQAMAAVVANGLTPTVYTNAGIAALAKAATAAGRSRVGVHLKVDTGMHRVGVAPERALSLALRVCSEEALTLQGVYTHFACADEPANPFTLQQGALFEQVLADLQHHAVCPSQIHAANSAGGLLFSQFRYSFVRCGIALYGLQPAPEVPLPAGVEPAMSVKAQVSMVKFVDKGDAVSYGQQYRLEQPSTIAVVPVGYADGVPRRLGSTGGAVVLAGKRRPMAGTITMDQFMVDCGVDVSVAPGDEVVLLGKQGDAQEISAWEWAERTDTIVYEIVCRIGPRLPRRYIGRVRPVSREHSGDSMPTYEESFPGRGRREHLSSLPPG